MEVEIPLSYYLLIIKTFCEWMETLCIGKRIVGRVNYLDVPYGLCRYDLTYIECVIYKKHFSLRYEKLFHSGLYGWDYSIHTLFEWKYLHPWFIDQVIGRKTSLRKMIRHTIQTDNGSYSCGIPGRNGRYQHLSNIYDVEASIDDEPKSRKLNSIFIEIGYDYNSDRIFGITVLNEYERGQDSLDFFVSKNRSKGMSGTGRFLVSVCSGCGNLERFFNYDKNVYWILGGSEYSNGEECRYYGYMHSCDRWDAIDNGLDPSSSDEEDEKHSCEDFAIIDVYVYECKNSMFRVKFYVSWYKTDRAESHDIFGFDGSVLQLDDFYEDLGSRVLNKMMKEKQEKMKVQNIVRNFLDHVESSCDDDYNKYMDNEELLDDYISDSDCDDDIAIVDNKCVLRL